MAEPAKPSGAPEVPKPNPAKQGNPAFRMLGLPRLRAKLPSRNWSIFWGVVASFSGAVIYDRRRKKQIQQKWCNAVSHLSEEMLDPSGLPRKLTVFLAAPPGDGIRPSREYFQEYVRPILVAAAVDWDVVEGRKEGDVRARLAERIRQQRRRTGEGGPLSEEEEDVVKVMRERQGIQETDTRGGDLVIGRHTWKEYMRGLHEGYLGPVRNPEAPEDQSTTAPTPVPEEQQPLQKEHSSSGPVTDLEAITGLSEPSNAATSPDEASPAATPSTDEKTSDKDKDKDKPAEKPKKPIPTPAYISIDSYAAASTPPSFPPTFAPAVFLNQPHLLGILNTPTRTVRFLNRRALAETTGSEVASLLLFTDTRPYSGPEGTDGDGVDGGSLGTYPSPPTTEAAATESESQAGQTWEQARIGAHAERDWHKIARAARPEGVEAVWQDPMVVDARIGQRMRAPVWSGGGGESTLRDEEPRDAATTTTAKSRQRDWTGGADRDKKIRSWPQWFVYVTGFADEREPRGLGARDGWVKSDDD